MAIFATLYWLIGNGTYSVDQQQAWIMWYSVTYQGITIPLFWLITGFTLQLFFNDDLSRLNKQVLVLLVFLGFMIIAFFHPSEAIYYAVFLFLSLLFTPSISSKQKIIYSILFFTIIPCILLVVATYMSLPFLHGVPAQNGFSSFIQQIDSIGRNITEHGGNRFHNSFSELAILSSFTAVIFWITTLFFIRKKQNRITTLLIVAIIIFTLIPTSKWIAGTTGMFLHENIVWRFFFASPWFLFIPLIVFTITARCRFPKTYASLLLIGILTGSVVMSQAFFYNTLSGNVYSLYNSFFKERVGLQYSDKALKLLKQTIDEQTDKVKKTDTMLYLRSDLATLARAIWGFNVYSHRRSVIPMHSFYTLHMEQQYNLIPIKLPYDFPKDRNIFLHFRLDDKKISQPQNLILNEDNSIRFDLDHIDLGKKYLFIEGWAFLEGQKQQSNTYVVLKSDQETYTFDTSQVFRRDVGKYFKSTELENQGFLATIPIKDLKQGLYRVGLLVSQNGQQGGSFTLSERSVTIAKEDGIGVSN